MVEMYPHNIWSRSKWQQERGAAKVAARACPRVSMAVELDRFHQAMAKGYNSSSAYAAARLEERVRTYVETVETRHPSWARRVAVQLGDRARAVRDEFDKIGRATDGFTNAALLVQTSYEAAEADIEDWMSSGGETRLNSRHLDMLLAGLRELYMTGQRLTYVTDHIEKGLWNDARRFWSAMDGRRSPDRLWLEGVNDLRVRLRAVVDRRQSVRLS